MPSISDQQEEAWLRFTDSDLYQGLRGELETKSELPEDQVELVLKWAWASGFSAGMFVEVE